MNSSVMRAGNLPILKDWKRKIGKSSNLLWLRKGKSWGGIQALVTRPTVTAPPASGAPLVSGPNVPCSGDSTWVRSKSGDLAAASSLPSSHPALLVSAPVYVGDPLTKTKKTLMLAQFLLTDLLDIFLLLTCWTPVQFIYCLWSILPSWRPRCQMQSNLFR